MNNFLYKERLRDKFSKLKQKVNKKLSIEEQDQALTNANNGNSYYNRLKVYYNNKKEANPIVQVHKGDYMERLQNFYKIKKDKFKYNLNNIQNFYRKRLDEKEATKVLKSITRWTLFSSFILMNYFLYRSNRKYKPLIFIFSSVFYLGFNVVVQNLINSRYKKRVRDLQEEVKKF